MFSPPKIFRNKIHLFTFTSCFLSNPALQKIKLFVLISEKNSVLPIVFYVPRFHLQFHNQQDKINFLQVFGFSNVAVSRIVTFYIWVGAIMPTPTIPTPTIQTQFLCFVFKNNRNLHSLSGLLESGLKSGLLSSG